MTTKINWRRMDREQELAVDESYFVAVLTQDPRTGKTWYDVHTIVTRVSDDDEEHCGYIETTDGDDPGFLWEDISFYVPLGEIRRTIPGVESEVKDVD